jgi:AmpE protein
VQTVSEGLLVQANDRLFGVLFWFFVLGPVGAVLYRLSWGLAIAEDSGLDDTEMDEEAAPALPGFTEAATRLYAILAWAPARLGAGAYALAGSFEDAVHQWRNYYQRSTDSRLESNDEVLRAAGSGALQLDRYVVQTEEAHEGDVPLEPAAVNAARGLVLRALVIWVATIVVVTLALWAY